MTFTKIIDFLGLSNSLGWRDTRIQITIKEDISIYGAPRIDEVEREGFLFFFFFKVPFSSRSASENRIFLGSVAALSPRIHGSVQQSGAAKV